MRSILDDCAGSFLRNENPPLRLPSINKAQRVQPIRADLHPDCKAVLIRDYAVTVVVPQEYRRSIFRDLSTGCVACASESWSKMVCLGVRLWLSAFTVISVFV